MKGNDFGPGMSRNACTGHFERRSSETLVVEVTLLAVKVDECLLPSAIAVRVLFELVEPMIRRGDQKLTTVHWLRNVCIKKFTKRN